MAHEQEKKAAGRRAADLVEDGMLVGIGSGSTVGFFIERLLERCREGLKIKVLSSSLESSKLLKKGKIPLLDEAETKTLDVTFDGADEVDEKKRLIKGGGGALLREKILAAMSREMVVIVDESKIVENLGKCRLPVEVLPFGRGATRQAIEKLGFQGTFRKEKETLFVTDNGNHIFDIQLKETTDAPEKIHDTLLRIPGVLETGFFFHLAGRLVIGFSDGQVVVRP